MPEMTSDVSSKCVPIDSVKSHLGNQNIGQPDEIGWRPNFVLVEKSPIRLVLKSKSLNLRFRVPAKESGGAGRAEPDGVRETFVPPEPTFSAFSMALYETCVHRVLLGKSIANSTCVSR